MSDSDHHAMMEEHRYRAEIERLTAAAVWHCEACGTVTRSGECDCTKLQTGTQRLVPYDYRACLDAEIERLRALVDGSTVLDAGHLEDKVERLQAALRDIIERWPTEEGMDGAIQRARTALSL